MPAKLDRLETMREFVTGAAITLGAQTDLALDAALATDEAVTNVIVHGYGLDQGEIELIMTREGNDLVIRILDAAPEFDPTLVPAPDLETPLELRAPGGFGVHLLRLLMDSVSYRRLPEGLNELTLKKREALH